MNEAPIQPLHDLLHSIKWDAEFGIGEFAVGYDDRVVGEEIRVPFASIRLDPERPASFSFDDDDGVVRHIPLHRVRTVYKDGVAVWRRPRAGGKDTQSPSRPI
jgi:uncharacterized protein (UPF0248 family)